MLSSQDSFKVFEPYSKVNLDSNNLMAIVLDFFTLPSPSSPSPSSPSPLVGVVNIHPPKMW